MSHSKQVDPPRKAAVNIPERPSKIFRGNAPSPSGSKRRAPMPRKQTAHVSMPIRPNTASNAHHDGPTEQETVEEEAPDEVTPETEAPVQAH